MHIDEKRIAERGAAAVTAAIKEWTDAGKPIDVRDFAVFMFSKGAAYGVDETRRMTEAIERRSGNAD